MRAQIKMKISLLLKSWQTGLEEEKIPIFVNPFLRRFHFHLNNYTLHKVLAFLFF